jgi:hypothetical protein
MLIPSSFVWFIVAEWSNCHHHDLNNDVTECLRVGYCVVAHILRSMDLLTSTVLILCIVVSSTTLPKPGPNSVLTHGDVATVLVSRVSSMTL